MSPSLHIRLLGEMELRRNGDVLPLPQSKKTRALLAFLALESREHRRERLCELLWQVPDDPRGALRWSLSKLRAICDEVEAKCIVADREHVGLDRTHLIIDTAVLEDAVKRGLNLIPSDELETIAESFVSEPLEGLTLSGQPEFEAWRIAQIDTIRNWQGMVLRELAQRMAGSDTERAVHHLRKWTEIDRFNADTHLALIRFLISHSRPTEAKTHAAIAHKFLASIDAYDTDAFEAALEARPKPRKVEPRPAPRPDLPPQDIHFCKAPDGVQIAYAACGTGPPLVKTANWLNHLEFDWESPIWRHVFRALTDEFTLIRYDSRGNGLSDWDTDEFSFDSMVADLEAVVDAAGLDKFPLLGVSQGCAVSVEYAVRHPERVTKLILFGGYARGWRIESPQSIIDGGEAMTTLILQGWGQDNPAFRQMFTSLFIPSGTTEEYDSFNELQRMTTSPKSAARLMDALGNVDIRHRLSSVTAPTLVIHNRGDQRVALSRGRELAAGIPGAKFISLDSDNHLLLEHDPAWPRFLEEVMTFLKED